MTVVTVKPGRINNLDKLFDEFFKSSQPVFRPRLQAGAASLPAANVIETDRQFRLELAAPGREKSDFTINIEKDVLTISAGRETPATEGETFRLREFGPVDFKRSWRLPETIDTAGIEARYDAGILHVVLPKKEEAQEKPARTIEIG